MFLIPSKIFENKVFMNIKILEISFPRFTMFEITLGIGLIFGMKHTVEAEIFQEIEAAVMERL